MPKDEKPILKPFNPLDKRNLGESIADALLQTEALPLPPEPFIGAGVYAIYYIGSFSVYGRLTEVNSAGQLRCPIYVGKAVPAGTRKGGLGLDVDHGQALYKRLAEHAESVKAARNLEIDDFLCRFLVVDDIWIPLALYGRAIKDKRDSDLPVGYNIVAGKKSFEVSKVLDPNGIAPTLVAMDMQHLFVVDNIGLPRLSLREGLRLFGFPDDFKFEIEHDLGCDLLGNTVVVPVITAVSERVIDEYLKGNSYEADATRSLRPIGRGRQNTRVACSNGQKRIRQSRLMQKCSFSSHSILHTASVCVAIS